MDHTVFLYILLGILGSYSYIDENGVKRTVHYVAGSSTGFQVIGSSPSSSHAVRIEAPPGFVLSRKRAHSQPELTASASSHGHPTTLVYHVGPDSSSWRPWMLQQQQSDIDNNKPRRLRKVMRMVKRKKGSSSSSSTTKSSDSTLAPEQNEVSNTAESTPLPVEPPRPFRHSTRVNLNIQREHELALKEASRAFYERRRVATTASHRAYTDKQRDVPLQDDDDEDEEGPRSDPILYAALNERARGGRDRALVPNPILLKPNAVSVKNRGEAVAVDASVNSNSNNGNLVTAESRNFVETTRAPSSLSTSTPPPVETRMREEFDISATSVTSTVTSTQQPPSQVGVVGPKVLAELEVSSTTTTSTTTTELPTTTTTEPTSTSTPDIEVTVTRARRRRGPTNNKRDQRNTKSSSRSSTVARMVRDRNKPEEEETELDIVGVPKVESRNIMSSSIRLKRKLHPDPNNN
jgi:hypothetical protein